MGFDPGRVTFHLHCAAGRVTHTEVSCARPDLAALRQALADHPLPAQLAAAAGDGPFAAAFARRVAVRRAELGDWLARRLGALGRVAEVRLGRGTGEASVLTARGMLIHRLELANERVGAYCIEAPTDRHFAANGEAAGHLAALRGLECATAKREARLLALLCDPCVPFSCAILPSPVDISSASRQGR